MESATHQTGLRMVQTSQETGVGARIYGGVRELTTTKPFLKVLRWMVQQKVPLSAKQAWACHLVRDFRRRRKGRRTRRSPSGIKEGDKDASMRRWTDWHAKCLGHRGNGEPSTLSSSSDRCFLPILFDLSTFLVRTQQRPSAKQS